MDNLVMGDDDDDADSDIIDFGRLRPTQEEEDAIGRAVTLDDESGVDVRPSHWHLRAILPHTFCGVTLRPGMEGPATRQTPGRGSQTPGR